MGERDPPGTEADEPLWGGRFDTAPAPEAAALSRSLSVDIRLAPQDIESSVAHVRDGGFDVLRRQADVDGQAPRQRSGLRSRRRIEPPTPQRLVGFRAWWIRLAHQGPCRADHTFRGMAHNLMNPSASRWSNASSGPYVANPMS